jgi:hypothetical protein
MFFSAPAANRLNGVSWKAYANVRGNGPLVEFLICAILMAMRNLQHGSACRSLSGAQAQMARGAGQEQCMLTDGVISLQ